VAAYLARKYGHTPEAGEAAGARVVALLGMLAARLAGQARAGSPYLVGHALSAADIHLAAAMALFHPLPASVCEMDPADRHAFTALDAPTRAALDPALLDHRDTLYADVLELPLRL
jgi:glutathione S-transferase